MKIEFRVQSQNYQGPDQVQFQLAATSGQANLNMTRPAAEATRFPVGSVVQVTVSSADSYEEE